MSSLQNFPYLNQNLDRLPDGRPDPNAGFDRVPTSLAAGLEYLTGTAFDGGVLKAMVYGADYTGGTSARAYIDYCQQQGVKLYPLDAPPQELVNLVHQHLSEDHPVVFTEPDPYLAGYTHVCVFHADEPGYLIALDPYIASDIKRSDAEWTQTLVGNEIWIMEKEAMAIDTTSPVVANFYTPAADGQWRCKQTGYIVQYGILAFYRSYGKDAYCGLTYLGLPKSNEIPVDGHPGVVKQQFERGWACYDPNHALDQPPGAGAVYLMHLP